MNTHTLATIMLFSLIIPVVLSIVSIQIWNHKSESMSLRDRDKALAKITIIGTIITSTSVFYAVLFNFYSFETTH